MGAANTRLVGPYKARVFSAKAYPALDEGVGGPGPPPAFSGSVSRGTSVAIGLTAGTAGTLSLWPTGYPDWSGGNTAYNTPPRTLVDGYRVVNAGRSYELNQDGTGAASGGPTGTTQAEADGTARWGYMGQGNGGSFTTQPGSLILTMVTRGNYAASPSPHPTDVSGGEDAVVLAGGARAYAGFPSSASICHLIQCPVGFANHVITWPYGLFSGGQRDEVSAIALNLTGVTSLHAWSYVERASATGGKILAAPITTTRPTLLITLVLGNGNVVAVGTKHAFVPTAPTAYVDHADTTLALAAAGYIQTRAYSQVLPAGVTNYQPEWTSPEGAQIYAFAFELASAAETPTDAKDGPAPKVHRPYFPEHFPLVAAGVTEPDYLWSFDNALGPMRDRSNNPRGVLTPQVNTSLADLITGWDRPFGRITAEATGSGFQTGVGNLWNIGSQSVLALFYAAVTVSGGTRCLWLGGGANGLQIEILAAGQATSFVNGVRTTGTFVYESATPTVYPFAYHWDRRGAGQAKLFTNKEVITSAWANLSDNTKGFGSPSLAAPQARIGLFAVWVGANAEAMMDRGGAGLGGKTLIADLGWPMAF